MTVFWDIAPFSHVEIARRFGGAYCLHHQCDSHASLQMFFSNTHPTYLLILRS
jgi:hypothetical protein